MSDVLESHGSDPSRVEYRVIRTTWGNDYQYHVEMSRNGVVFARSTAPEWAYSMQQQLLEGARDHGAGTEQKTT